MEANDAHAKFINLEGDHLTMMNAFHEYKRQNMDVDWCFQNFLNHRHLKSSDDVRDQLKVILEKMGIFVKDDIPIQPHVLSIKKCILTGYFTQVSILQKNNVYLTSKFVYHIFSQRLPGSHHPPQLSVELSTRICSL